jgi:hypothetical protein
MTCAAGDTYRRYEYTYVLGSIGHGSAEYYQHYGGEG